MSDLIDFDSPSTSSVRLQQLASPLIPAPEKSNDSSPREAGSHFLNKRGSLENNPFDLILKKATDYERNKEDPFERVTEKAMGYSDRVSIQSKDNLVSRCTGYADSLKKNKVSDETEKNLDFSRSELVQEEDDISIITDLNDTNLIGDGVDGRQIVESWNCDNKVVPNVNISMVSNKDLSILNESAMNDSLLGNSPELLRNISVGLNDFPRSMSQSNFLSPNKCLPQGKNRRSMSVPEVLKNNMVGENSVSSSVQSSAFEDPFNEAFRNSTKSNWSSTCSFLNSQVDLSSNKQKPERLNSDSSVFSAMSNISSIPMDSVNRIRHDRFCSEGSVVSGISNLSMIPPENTVSSTSDLSLFSNETMNKGFVTSSSEINSTNSAKIEKTPLKSGNSDLIKKFFEIKTRMSTSQPIVPNFEENLVDIDTSSNSVFNDQASNNDMISHEAKTLADTFEKMASTIGSNSTNDDDLLLSKTPLNFDDLPLSDNEAVDNLIDLSPSPIKKTKQEDVNTETKMNANVMTQSNLKILESEFIEQKACDKKAAAATLLSNLEKLIETENNPQACKTLHDLQKLLGVESKSNVDNTKISMNSFNESENKENVQDNLNLDRNIPNGNSKISESNSNSSSENLDDTDSESNIKNIESTKSNKIEIKENLDELSQDQKLAVNLLDILNKIINKDNEDSTADVLQNLGSVINMATELRTKSKEKQQNFDLKVCEKNMPKRLNRSTNSYISPTPKNIEAKSQNKSFDHRISPLRRSISVNHSSKISPLRRSISVNPITNNKLLEVPKDKRKSHLINIKKCPSDSGLMSRLSINKAKSPRKEEGKSTLETSKTILDPIKSKIKKKLSSDVISKKGPLKAVIPLNNMQKGASQTMSEPNGIVTPPKRNTSSKFNMKSSTPNLNSTYENTKSKPKASSTPNTEEIAKSQRPKIQQTSKTPMKYNLSPVPLNSTKSSPKGNISLNKKPEPASSPQRRPITPKKDTSFNASASGLPRYSPRPMRVRNYSMNELKPVNSPQRTSMTPKVAEKKTSRQTTFVLSSMNNCKLGEKIKPLSLVSKLRKSSSFNTGPEKENYV